MKNIGLLLLAIGVAVSASFGARLAPDVSDELTRAKRGKVLAAAAKEAKAAYCTARTTAKLPFNQTCLSPEALKAKKAADAKEAAAKKKAAAEKKAAEKAAAKTAAAKTAAEKTAAAPKAKPDPAALMDAAQTAHMKLVKQSDKSVSGPVKQAQTLWLDLELQAAEAGVTAKLVKPTDPGLRLSQWFSQSGFPFLGGLLLVLVGAIIGRKAVKAEATGTGKKKGPEAVDFGALLKSLNAEVSALADGMDEVPTAGQLDQIKSRIEALQFEAFEPIVEARGRIQARFGIADYAELFSPFSSAERRINRSWSALVDGHWPEARDSMRIAAAHLAEAETVLDRLLAKG